MIIRTAKAREASFKLLKDRMLEQPNFEIRRWFLYRTTLRQALGRTGAFVFTYVAEASGEPVTGDFGSNFAIKEGLTQRGKKYIEIGCKRFVGVNRTRLINWAKRG